MMGDDDDDDDHHHHDHHDHFHDHGSHVFIYRHLHVERPPTLHFKNKQPFRNSGTEQSQGCTEPVKAREGCEDKNLFVLRHEVHLILLGSY